MVVEGEGFVPRTSSVVSLSSHLYARGLLACQLTSCALVAFMQQCFAFVLVQECQGLLVPWEVKEWVVPEWPLWSIVCESKAQERELCERDRYWEWWWKDGAASLRRSIYSFVPRAPRVGRS